MAWPARARRCVGARSALASWLVGLTLLPHLVRLVVHPVLGAGVARAAAASVLFALCTIGLACAASGRQRWGGLAFDDVALWLRDAACFGLVAVLLFVPAAVFAARTPSFGAAAVGVLLPAAVEELAFRGVLGTVLPRLLNRAGVPAGATTATAILLGSVAFAAAHHVIASPGPWVGALVQRCVAGVLFSLLARTSGSLLAPMFAHAAYDAVVLAPWLEP